MRERRYILQGGVILVFIIANLLFSGLAFELYSSILLNDKSKLIVSSIQAAIGLILVIAISPSIGYLLYIVRHAIFLFFGGWSSLYEKNGIKEYIDRCPDIIDVKNLDVKASFYFCNSEIDKGFVEWIRRRMDAYLISTAMSLQILITNLTFIFITYLLGIEVNINQLSILWFVSLCVIIILLYVALKEKRSGVEGFRLFFAKISDDPIITNHSKI